MSAASPLDAPGAVLPQSTAARSRGFWHWGEARFDPRHNSLNLLRLVLAYAVLVAHGWYLSGAGTGPQIRGENIGGWAVFGFFAISGYLITGSRWTKPIGEYLVHRVARIFPAFLVCLVVTAFVFAPVNWVWTHGSLAGFFSTPTTPVGYVLSNITLRMNAYDVAGTPTGVPYPGAWDGSLWSLYYEFACYLVVAVLGTFAIFRRSAWPLTVAFVVSVALQAQSTRVLGYAGNHADVPFMLKLLPFFLAGGLLYVLRERVSLTWPLAVAATALGAVLVLGIPGWGAQLAAPLVAYVVLWLGAVLPMPGLLRKHDVSYGIYIYAFPVQQLLAMAGAHHLGLVAYDLLAAVATIPLAVGSWLLVERPVMRRARGRVAVRTPPVAAPSSAPVPEGSTPVAARAEASQSV
ncbi:acyltransferase family protein [Cellulomonas sp. P5_C5]